MPPPEGCCSGCPPCPGERFPVRGHVVAQDRGVFILEFQVVLFGFAFLFELGELVHSPGCTGRRAVENCLAGNMCRTKKTKGTNTKGSTYRVASCLCFGARHSRKWPGHQQTVVAPLRWQSTVAALAKPFSSNTRTQIYDNAFMLLAICLHTHKTSSVSFQGILNCFLYWSSYRLPCLEALEVSRVICTEKM